MAANVAALVSGDVLNRIFRFGATVVLARSLTLGDFGVLNTAIAVAGLAAMLASFGLVDHGTRQVAVGVGDLSGLASQILTIRISALAVVCAAPLIVLLLLGHVSGALLGGGVAMAVFMTTACDWILRGLERMRVLAYAWSAGGAVVALGAVIVAWTSGSAAAALWAYAAGEAVVALVGWMALRRVISPGFSRQGWKPLVSASWPLAISTVVIYAYTANLDTILLTGLRSADEAGLYSAPYRVFWVLSAIVIFAAYAALPRFSRQSIDGRDEAVRRGVVLLGRVLGCYALVVIGLVEILGHWTLGFVFGARFGQMDGVFVALAAGLSWYAVGFPSGQSLIASNDNRGFMYGAAIAGTVNLIANLVAIPLYGPIGAAWATTGSFALGSVIWLWRRQLQRGEVAWLVGAALFATASSSVADSGLAAPWLCGLLTLGVAAVGIVSSVAPVRQAW